MTKSQNDIIKEAIDQYLDKGLTDKQDIYTLVVQELGVPRPTVRRAARDLRNEMLDKIQVLNNEIPKPIEKNIHLCKHGINLYTHKCRDCDAEVEASKLIRRGEID